ncbi:MAG TPA: endonuclease/exonuclease/phosphatase family protein [Gaiella sp.]
MSLLVRTWNLFHGNAVPPVRRSFVREALALATSGRPAVVCLQEVPVWTLPRLEEWSGMQTFPAIARRGLRPAGLAGWLTRLHNGLFRSLLTGQANAVLVAHEHAAEGLGAVSVSARGSERRVCQAVRVDGRLLVGNTHLSSPADTGHQVDELDRCVAFLEGLAREGEPIVLAGDLNHSRPALDRFSPGLDGVDHVLVRGATTGPAHVWPRGERTVDGRVLSDHAPVEVVVET